MSEPHDPWPGRGVERALVATFLLHGLAMLAMATLLLPMMPGGPTADDRARVALLAAHATRWRLGWLPWGLTAVSDVALAAALVRWPRVPRALAWTSLLLVCAAVVPDQLAQVLWVTRGVALARAGNLGAYLAFEGDVFRLTGAWAALLYTASAVAWCACLAAAGAWSRGLSRLSSVLFPLFAAAAVAPLLPAPNAVPSWSVGAANAVAFVGFQAWLLAVLERTAMHARPDTAYGRHARWRAPLATFGARLSDRVANSRALERLLALPAGRRRCGATCATSSTSTTSSRPSGCCRAYPKVSRFSAPRAGRRVERMLSGIGLLRTATGASGRGSRGRCAASSPRPCRATGAST